MDSPSNKPVVMVVDDERSGAEALGILLEQAGYEILSAHSGHEALARAAQTPPDLVLLDVMMPGMDGFETCQRLHRLPGLADLPVIFLTGSTERSAIARAFNTGALDYVTKPFLLEELLARVKTHADLKQSRDRLGRMLKEREDVTNVVAHDLKNPLTCVLFAAESLNRPAQSPERRAELVAEIVDNTRTALEFIQRFLSRGAEGQRLRQFSARRVDLIELARQAARAQRTAAESREVSLVVSGDPAEAGVDPDVTRNVLQNLLANAIQYSPAGSRIDIHVAKMPTGFAQCRVMDRGPGIAAADEARLFTRFLSLASASARAQYSSGLGLAIAKHDVTQMGGYLWYQSREGGGSIFGFDLPAP
ncbi:MAG: hybrid sensor histidine kinase/response regulator [Panacagrimonas sp.]